MPRAKAQRRKEFLGKQGGDFWTGPILSPCPGFAPWRLCASSAPEIGTKAKVASVLAGKSEASARLPPIVTHGGVVGMLYRHVMRIALDERREYALLNASINRFRYVESRWFLDVWGDVSHLAGLAAGDDL